MSTSRKIAKNTVFQIASKATTSVFSFVGRKLLTNYLGPSGFGDFTFSLNYANLFSSLADWGTQLVSVREASRNPRSQPRIFGTSFILRLTLSVSVSVVALLLLYFQNLSPLVYTASAISTLLIILFALKASLGQIYDTLLRQDRWYFVELVTAISSLLLFTINIYYHLPLPYFILSLVIASTIATLVAYTLSRSLVRLDLTVDFPAIRKLALQALPVGGIIILFNFYNRLDTILLHHLSTSTVVGFYGLAYFLYENLIIVAAYVMNSSLPILSPLVTPDGPTPSFRLFFQKIYDLMLTLGLLVALTTLVLAPPLIHLISNSQFAPSVPLLRILGLAALFSYLNHVTGYSLIALRKQSLYFLISFCALVLNLLINLIAIPSFGAFASAWATVATEALVQILSFFLISQSLNHFPSLTSFPKTTLEFIRTRGRIF